MTSGARDDLHPGSQPAASLSASEVARMFEHGDTTSVEITEQLIARIEAVDQAGPRLRSVLEIAPDALDTAAALDAERRAGHVRGPLHGVPVLVKDNIDTAAPLHTTAGSLVFGDSSPPRDAALVQALRDAGALILAKTNLSEWANFRGRPSSSGWSAAGGQTRNPHALDRTPGGSSSGSASAVAARLAPLAVGTETDGSIICPAAACGVLGLKPTVGLVSRTGIIPISGSQDTPGPIGRSVEDVALLLEVLARAVGDGEDPLASAKRRPSGHESHYVALIGDGNLSGLRVGVPREGGYFGYHPPTDRVFSSILETMAGLGAEIVDPCDAPGPQLYSGEDELVVLAHEFRVGAEQYFARRAAGDGRDSGLPRTLDDVIGHAEGTPAERKDLFGIELLVQAAETRGLDSPEYRAAFDANRKRSRSEGLDRLFGVGSAAGAKRDGHEPGPVDLVAVPAMSPAWLIDHVIGDEYLGAGWSPPAVAGYPSATIPIGTVGDLPVGVALWGPPWSEAMLLRVMFALERALGPEVTSPVPPFAESVSLRG